MRKRVLLVALNWGLGHTTRLIPVIHEIILEGGMPIFAGNSKQKEILGESFPEMECLYFSGLNIEYSKGAKQGLKLMLQTPKVLFQLIREHRDIRKIVRDYSIDAIVSDNVYGAYHHSVPSIFICHQIAIKLPFSFRYLTGIVKSINLSFIRKFTSCWIPDFPGDNGLAGELSHPSVLPENCAYIGSLSRFEKFPQQTNIVENKVLILISGPEPQRSLLENLILSGSKNIDSGINFVWVRGLFEKQAVVIENSYAHLAPEKLAQEILSSEIIICRSGYSSIMDLLALNRTALLIPTPGQTEQEYLAESLASKGYFKMMDQGVFELSEAIRTMRRFSPKKYVAGHSGRVLLKSQIRKLLSTD